MINPIDKMQILNISFSGRESEPVMLAFPETLSFIYGASNTGKSFAAKSLDYMLGGSKDLPDIAERRPYNRIQLELQVGSELVRLERAISGGDFEVTFEDGTNRVLSSRHNADNDTNLSNFLLKKLKLDGLELAKDKSGTKKNLSFRDLIRFCIVDETSIQSEISPVETGDKMLAITERNAFKFLLTGEDDSALITYDKPKDFKTGRTAQVRFIEEMICKVESDIALNFPDINEIDDLYDTAEAELKDIEKDIVSARLSITSLLDKKNKLKIQISNDQQRIIDVSVSVDNFEQLSRIYISDVGRLEAVEEAGFLLTLGNNDACPVCGSAKDAHVHEIGYIEVEALRAAAEAEIAKIQVNQLELEKSIAGIKAEQNSISERLSNNYNDLLAVEAEILDLSPNAVEQQFKFSEIIPRRDRLKKGIALRGQLDALVKERNRIAVKKQVVTKSNFTGGLSTNTAQDFADEVSRVLQEWGFPGDRHVVFDLASYDLIIDGKRRKDNGKGVRAITHAAFKVAMLTFCHARGLPHPGFLVLDTPLITYRDPMSSTLGELSEDELAIKKTNLKEKFFEHLSGLNSVGQFIVFENVDPPSIVLKSTHIEVFTNDHMSHEGRQGLL